ncbi:type II secretion system secretin GspD [Pseudomonas fontis]|uniref:Type II secretion system secretin GspD n=1 Tax=Pseudomonas fontis TaxID=2942633 RepID=A0ABT5NQ49_9PSED|nr:type II secretion system secretin GspD [Pseudomonas fontis]MDD0972848.1 type II secretion system secretin GspD [Pseudomonas fontis]MDD0990305.1 type II secretion system secretin GspD [Pseudomonas fontis]
MKHFPSALVPAALALCLSLPTAFAAEQRWQLNMRDAELRTVALEISSMLGRTVVLDPKVAGKVSVVSSRELNSAQVRELLVSVLDANGYTLVDQGDVLRIVPITEAKGIAAVVAPGAASSEFVTRVLPLEAGSATEMAALIRPLVSSNGFVGPAPASNALVVTDRAQNVERIAEVLRKLDKGGSGNQNMLHLKHAWAADVAKVLSESLGKGSDAHTQVISDTRSNRLLLIGTPQTRQRLTQLAQAMDVPPSEQVGGSQVIRLRHGDAKEFADMLSDVGQRLRQGGGDGRSNDARAMKDVLIKAHESQNALVVVADPEQVRSIENIVKQLDQPRAQVLIQAAIVEVTGDVSEALGVQWGGSGNNASGAITFPGVGAAIGALTGKELPEGALLEVGGGAFKALLSALMRDNNSNLMSTPSLLTLDNQEANILVGQNVPFQTGSYASGGNSEDKPFTTTQREDIGLTLKIKPHINQGDSLRLEIEQENSEITPAPTGVTASDIITNKRSIKTTVLASNGQVIVLGGLMRDNIKTQVSMVPGLGRLPLVGGLFRWTNEVREKTNLMVFLRPTIIDGPEAAGEVGRRKYNALRLLDEASTQRQHGSTLPAQAAQLFDEAGQ